MPAATSFKTSRCHVKAWSICVALLNSGASVMKPKRTRWNSTFPVKPDAKRLRGRRRLDVGLAPKKRIGRRVDPRERKWRKEVLTRDEKRCQFPGCQVVSPNNDAHHVAKRSQRPDIKWDVANGKTLCREHHSWIDSNHDEAVAIGLLDTTSYELARKELAA